MNKEIDNLLINGLKLIENIKKLEQQSVNELKSLNKQVKNLKQNHA